MNIEQLKNFSQLTYYQRGEPVYVPYQPADSIFLIETGKVKLSYISGRRKLTMATLGGGELFGEMTLAGEPHRELKAEALENSSIWIINRGDFIKSAQKNPSILPEIIKLFTRRLFEARRKLTRLAFKDLETRLSCLLLNLAKEFGEKTKEGRVIGNRITHQELAELIGCTRTSVTTCLNQLEEEGIITKRKFQIVIKDRTKLAHKASQDGEW